MVSFLMVNDFVCLAYSLRVTKFAEIFRIYAGQIRILCECLKTYSNYYLLVKNIKTREIENVG